MFGNISIIKKGDAIPQDDFALFLTADGVYKKQKNMLGYGMAKVDEKYLEAVGLEKVGPAFTYTAPQIPKELWDKVVQFFVKIYDMHKTEAAALILYNPETQDWDILVPNQKVNSAHASYDLSEIIATDERLSTGGFNVVGTTHSHGSMGAFWSATDDADELKFDGIHITVGKVNSTVEYAASVVFGGVRFKMKISDLVAMEEPVLEPEMAQWVSRVQKDEPKKYVPASTTSATSVTSAPSLGSEDLDEEKLSKLVMGNRRVYYSTFQRDIVGFTHDYEWNKDIQAWLLRDWVRNQEGKSEAQETSIPSEAATPSKLGGIQYPPYWQEYGVHL